MLNVTSNKDPEAYATMPANKIFISLAQSNRLVIITTCIFEFYTFVVCKEDA